MFNLKLKEPTKFIKTESLHMIVDGEFIQDHCRQLYWFEDNEEGAYKILKEGLRGITNNQVMNIINGDAILRGSSICKKKNCRQCKGLKQISYSIVEDTDFKLEITKRKLWLHETNYKIGQYHISKYIIRDYLEKLREFINQDDDDEDYHKTQDILRIHRESIWHNTSHRIPSTDYIPDKDSRDYKFTTQMNYFLKDVERQIRNALDENQDVDKLIKEILLGITIFKETTSKVKLKPVKAIGCTVLKIPDPKNNYRYKSINIQKEHLLNYLDTRSRGERSLKFTLNLDMDKDKVLKRYENLTKAMGLVHEKLMKSLNLNHNPSGIYSRNTLEFFVNEAVQFFVLRTSIWHEGKTLEKLPDEIKLKLPPNHGYVDVYVDGKLVEEKRDLR